MESPAGCTHPTLKAASFDPPVTVPGVGSLHELYGVYWCAACGDAFNLEPGVKRLPPDQLLVLAHGYLALHAQLTHALTANLDPGDGDSQHGLPRQNTGD